MSHDEPTHSCTNIPCEWEKGHYEKERWIPRPTLTSGNITPITRVTKLVCTVCLEITPINQ